MADLVRLVSLHKIVSEALALAEKPKEKFFPFFQTLINGVMDLQLFHINSVKRVLLDMDSNYVIDFPTDFISFVSLSIPINGKNHIFIEDNELLAIETTDYSWRDSLDEKSTVSYGTRGGKGTDYFRIDWENQRFVFNSPSQREEVILTYISSGVDLTAETEVPLVTKQSLVTYILWRNALYDIKIPYTQTELLKEDYEREIEKLRALELPDVDAIRDAIRKSYRQSPKR